MSSALGYYAAKNRASTRLENKRTEIGRSSAYILDTGGSSYGSGKSSYSSTLTRESSFSGDSGRAGRSKYRDRSLDLSTRIRQDKSCFGSRQELIVKLANL